MATKMANNNEEHGTKHLRAHDMREGVNIVCDFYEAGGQAVTAMKMLLHLRDEISFKKRGPKTTDRAKEIDALLKAGRTPREICDALRASATTVYRRQKMIQQSEACALHSQTAQETVKEDCCDRKEAEEYAIPETWNMD